MPSFSQIGKQRQKEIPINANDVPFFALIPCLLLLRLNRDYFFFLKYKAKVNREQYLLIPLYNFQSIISR